MVVGFLILSFITTREWLSEGLIYSAVTIGVLSLISVRMHQQILRLWFGLAKILGFVNSRIILTVVYFLILVPMAILSRLLGRITVQLKKREGESYFVTRNHKYSKADLENPW